ncbi:MAG: hypothetical protein EPO24_03405 [Bacteroidetes bacterium]|nr:MAG: hypothetical protein EPO24_03405 [Bacteroidota bacterium]
MKTNLLLSITLMLLFVNTGNAQKYFPDYASYQHTDFNRVAKVYLIALQSENEGVVTSTLAHIGRIKLYFPKQQFPELEAKIIELSTTGQTSNIRYRAFLVYSLFNSPSIFMNESLTEFEDSEALFAALAGRLGETTFGLNSSR